MKSNLGEYLYDLRKKSGKTIKVLKEELKISPQYLNDIENNKRIPSDKLLRNFAETYKLGVDEKTILFDLDGTLTDSQEGIFWRMKTLKAKLER